MYCDWRTERHLDTKKSRVLQTSWGFGSEEVEEREVV